MAERGADCEVAVSQPVGRGAGACARAGGKNSEIGTGGTILPGNIEIRAPQISITDCFRRVAV